eukprot:TRINITY_DN67206_c6_g2_i2.p1 TRINITY_DN67206_c6_g2~~TRINITY_DN67206_c6_g2_i2.p1  ORF type:complete len:435 (+),score=19.12 TRINITY_DN67206_c6_g2_i2:18-1322(+)
MLVLRVIKAAANAIAQIIAWAAIGFLLRKKNILDKSSTKALAKVVITVFIPCLCIHRLAGGGGILAFTQMPILPIAATLYCGVGLAMGYLIVHVLNPTGGAPVYAAIRAACMIGNSSGLPIVFSSAVVGSYDKFQEIEGSETKALLFVALYLPFLYLYLYGIAAPMIDASAAAASASATDRVELVVHTSSSTTEAADCDGLDEQQAGASDLVPGGAMDQPQDDTKQQQKETPKKKRPVWVERILSILTPPPMRATIAGCIIGSIPFLQKLMYNREVSPLFFLGDVTKIGEGGVVGSTLICLGSNLYASVHTSSTAEAGKPSRQVTIAVCLVRGLLMPLLACAFVLLVDHLGLIPKDPVLRFVLLLEGSMPTANTINSLATAAGCSGEYVSQLVFWQFVCAVPLLTAWTGVFLFIAFNGVSDVTAQASLPLVGSL